MLRLTAMFLWAVLMTAAARAQAPGVLSLVPADTQTPVTLYSKSYALVVGIDGYSNGWPRLSNAIKDAREVAKELTARGFEVTTIIDPKWRELREKLEDFIIFKGSNPSARLFIWFAGHGHTLGGEGYLVPADAPLPQQEAQFRRQALSLRTFGRLMREAKSKHVLAVFDSCFAGTVFNTARALPTPAITRATLLPVRQFVSSGEAEQEVSDDGTFRRLFLDALRGNEPIADANQDGYITGTELGLFLSDKVTNLTRNLQTPRYGKLREVGLDRGDFVFALPRTRPPVTPQPPVSEAAAAWRAVERSTSCGVVRAFRDEYRGSVWERLASARLDELKCATVAPVAEPRAPAGPSRTCEGVTVSLGSGGTACINPGSGKTFRDCPTCPEMVVVPAGSFMMGSPKDEPGRASDEDQVRVTIAKPFAVGAYEVTFDEWDACVAAGGCDGYKPPDLGWGRGRRPVINVSWHDARVYANWLSAKTGQPYRLLSEAEWEYAARAGTTTPFWWGSSITPEQANYRGTISYAGGSIGEYRQRTLPVDSFAPNPWGLFNVHGNVWEWTEDCWNSSNKGNPGDGTARAEGSCSSRLVRGGSLDTNPQLVRSASRSLAGPTIRGSLTIRGGLMGFRLARMLLPPSP